MGEQFGGLLFSCGGKRRYACRIVSAQDATRAPEFYIRKIDARDTVRVAVNDRHDYILRERKIGHARHLSTEVRWAEA